ncbi:hypothetical protein J3F83DRAFT_259087 [Trichoderma novae-zelandiae]
MDLDETVRLGGRCSVWGCEDPIIAEALCSAHLAYNFPPKAPGSEPTFRPLHKAKRTRRFALGRASARSAKKSPPQETACSPNQKDSTLAHLAKELPTPPASDQLPNHCSSDHIAEHPSVLAPENTTFSRRNRATAEDASASTIAAEAMPLRPREPYFVLNPDIPSIDKNYSGFSRQHAARDLPESRHVLSTKTSPGVDSAALVDELVQAGLEFASNLRFSLVQSASTTHETLPSAIPSARVGDLSVEELPSITVVKTPSRRRPSAVNSHRREASTIHVYQETGQHSQVTEHIPSPLFSKKRKADAADVQPRIKEPSQNQRQEPNSTASAPERQTRSRSSAQSDDGAQNAPLGKSSKHQSSGHSDGQPTSHPRSSKRIRTSKEPMPVTEIAQAKANGQLEILNHVHGETPHGSGGHGSTPNSQQARQPKPRESGSRDERESITIPPPSTPGKDPTAEDQTTPAARQSAAQELSKSKVRVFDSEAFDAMIYRQSSLRPPTGVPRQAAARPKSPAQKPSTGEERRYLAVNPAIHLPHNRSHEWYKRKALEIQGRGGRKAWFGKVIERRRCIRAKERADEEEQNAATASNKQPRRVDPQPWTYDRIMDFGDVPEDELPEDVLQNPAWVKACAWHRENEAKRALRDRAAREAHREAWSYAESIMNDAELASESSGRPSKQ